jgi:hypothetical protein
MNSVIYDICNSVKMSSFLLWSKRVYPAVLLRKRISAYGHKMVNITASLNKPQRSKVRFLSVLTLIRPTTCQVIFDEVALVTKWVLSNSIEHV